MNRKTAQRFAWILVGVFFYAMSAQAQFRTSIQGVVTDPAGAVVVGANLTLTNPATGEKQIRVSNDSGIFNFNGLAAARFRLEVEKQGFQKQRIDNLELLKRIVLELEGTADTGS